MESNEVRGARAATVPPAAAGDVGRPAEHPAEAPEMTARILPLRRTAAQKPTGLQGAETPDDDPGPQAA